MIVLDFLIGSHNGHYEAFDCTGCQDKSNTTELLRAIHAVKGVAPRLLRKYTLGILEIMQNVENSEVTDDSTLAPVVRLLKKMSVYFNT